MPHIHANSNRGSYKVHVMVAQDLTDAVIEPARLLVLENSCDLSLINSWLQVGRFRHKIVK